jgi:hypothetical protein
MLTFGFAVGPKIISDDMTVIGVGAASGWIETIRAACNRNWYIEFQQTIMAEPTICTTDVRSWCECIQTLVRVGADNCLYLLVFGFADPS